MQDQHPEARQIKVFDTTLRDGQQCPGAGMSFEKNLEYANLACDLKVDVLEAGFPSASALDFEIVHSIAALVRKRQGFRPVVAGLCQLREEQVIRTIEALAPLIPLGKARLHTYVPVDPELMPASLGSLAANKALIVEEVYRLVKMARDAGMEVQFSPEGYSRMRDNFQFTTELILAAIKAGATIINCPDTIGGACSAEGSDYFVHNMNLHAAIVAREFPDRAITWSVHCHNDFGLAVQNTLNAVFDGPATQIEGCINGIGERAGNAALEQCIMLIKQFGGKRAKAVYTGIETPYLQLISDFVGEYMLPRQPHWPICGENAAKHSSGGHTNAILKNPLAYQPFDPSQVGRSITFLFGPLSGGNHAKAIIEAAGFLCKESEKAEIAQYIKDRYKERRKGITDEELLRSYIEYRQPIKVERVDYSRDGDRSVVRMFGRFFGEDRSIEETHQGKDSALAAAKTALEKQFGKIQVLAHRSQSESAGVDACSISEIVIADERGKQYAGVGKDHDIEISAIRALANAVNKAFIDRHYALNKVRKAAEIRFPVVDPVSVA